MKERPLPFTEPMVRAILSGAKTQTRRIVKWPVYCLSHGGRRRLLTERDVSTLAELIREPGRHPDNRPQCPHGAPGDRIWVKEKFLIETSGSCRYDAEGLSPGEYPEWLQRASIVHYAATTDLTSLGKWKSSRFMPRWVSRITLELTEVRVQRLQDVTWQDCMSEGIKVGFTILDEGDTTWIRGQFEELWDSINAKRGYPWESNCWVWALTFKVVQP